MDGLKGLRGRPRFSKGSMAPRFNPRIAETGLNVKLGPRMPNPLVRETNSSAIQSGNFAGRRRLVGLPDRFNKD
jgi:hypothetical protein